jgi:cell division protein FtsW (lipid II flippase)
VILLGRSMKMQNRFGRILALSAVLPLMAQGVGAVALNLGFVLTSASFPLFSGNLHTVLSMAMMGLIFSVFRQQALPEWEMERMEIEREKMTKFA